MLVKRKRYKTLSRFENNKIDVVIVSNNVDFGDSITDKSFFEPSQEAVKRVKAIQSASLTQSLFDSEKDLNNPDFSVAHRKKGIDLAELSNMVIDSENDFRTSYDKDVKKGQDKLAEYQDKQVKEVINKLSTKSDS